MDELQDYLDKLSQLKGPFVIIGRGHSGTTFLANIFIENDIFLGNTLKPNTSDSLSFRFNFIQPLINSKYFPHWEKCLSDVEFQDFSRKLLLSTLDDFIQFDPQKENWGWKLPSSCFVLPVVKMYFPSAKFVHIIRDGRDVILSQGGIHNVPFLRSKYRNPLRRLRDLLKDWTEFDKYVLNMTFNTSSITRWNGIDLNSKTVSKIRYQLGILSWKNCINTAREYGKRIPNDYCEIRYEDLCDNPTHVLGPLFKWLNIDLSSKAEAYAKAHAHTKRVGKWKRPQLSDEEADDFQKAVELGSSLLTELAYSPAD